MALGPSCRSQGTHPVTSPQSWPSPFHNLAQPPAGIQAIMIERKKRKCQEFCPQGQLWSFVPCPVAAFLEYSHPLRSTPHPYATATPHKQCVLRDQGLGPFPMGALVTLGRVCQVAPMLPMAGAQVLAPDPAMHQGGPALHHLQSNGSRPGALRQGIQCLRG